MHKLNPFAKQKQQILADAAKKSNANRKKALAAKRSKDAKKAKKGRNATWNDLQSGLK